MVAEKDREKLTVALPIRLGAGSFTEEELRSWGYSDKEIEELQGADELLLQWQHVPQGLAPIAPFWNVYMALGLGALFDEEFHKWLALFVDDILGYGYTKQHAADRQRIVSMTLKKLGKRVSEKLDRTMRQEGHIAGMKFTPEGVVIADEAVDALVEAMGENVKSLKAAQRLVGILIYAQSSFKWYIDGQTIHAELLNVLHRAMSAPQFKWTGECKRAVEMLRERVKVAPRVACRPDELLNDGWCLVIKSDASNTGAGACLLLVKCEDARNVTEEMLADPSKVKLISTLSKVLSDDEKKWLTFEQEAYGMYLTLRKWGRFLMQATIDHPDRCLVGLFMNSSTAVSQWLNITVPGNIDFRNAKALKFRCWVDKVKFVRYMNMYLAWAPGGVNDWADLLSRIAEKLAAAAMERERQRKMMPIMRHSHHSEGEEK